MKASHNVASFNYYYYIINKWLPFFIRFYISMREEI